MSAHDGDAPLDLTSCESEPIHIPGFIQPHGVLLALDTTTFVIEQVSENSGSLLGVAPGELIGKSPTSFLGQLQFEQLAAALRAQPFEPGAIDVIAGPNQERMECVYSCHRGALLLELQPAAEQSLDLLDISLGLQAPLSRMERSSGVDDLVCIVAKEIREITRFDRVMVYRFDEDWHGEVLAENVSDRLPIAYLGLHFPASDIPAQARELYLLNTLRLIPDTEYVSVPIVPTENPRLHAPLDLSRSDLRSVSPIHVEYLRNIGVQATLTISIIVHGKLWGLVACHNASPRRLSHAVRSTCNFFVQMFALKLSARLDQAQLSRRLDAGECIMKFIADLDPTQSVWKALRHNAAELLRIFAADALFLRGPEGVTLHGTSLSSDDLGPAIARLEEAAAKDDLVSSSSLCKLHDDARRYALEVSGALYVRLSLSENHCLVILRREQSASVKWAGNPNKAALADPGKGRLSPRASFAAWEEITHCESSRWSAGDLDKAAILREQLIYWQQVREDVRLLAHYDSLTELPNRGLLDELLKRSLKEADAQNELVGVLFIDVDRFKRFNARLGHAAGDRVLRHVAARISRAVRESDIVSRLGGDEFVVIMPALSDRIAAEGIAQRLIEEISRPIPGLEGHDLRVTVSIGISVYPDDGITSEALLSKADAAMSGVKERGSGAWQSYVSEQTSVPSDLRERAAAVAQALDRSEIVAHFQPIIDLTHGGVAAVEALARWNHPVNGLLGPAAFIEVVEATDLIVRMGEAMLDQSCRQVSQWRRTSAPNLRVAVNVSPRQLRDFGFVKTVRTILERYQLPTEALELEITEGMLAGDTSQSINALQELADTGIRIAIDDFGTGYSSFNYLRRLPVNALKIDQSFIAELNSPRTCESGGAIVRAIISVAKSLGLEVVGEGVETPAQLEILRALGCNYAQGYHIGRPLTAAAYSSFAHVLTAV